MALSDCSRCWDTPCTCGHYFRNYSVEAVTKHVVSVVAGKEKETALEILEKAINQVKERKE
jgi:predicted RNA-binding protein with PIN domain